MKTIQEEVKTELIIKNSKFITILKPLQDLNIKQELEIVKALYPKATHYCYAYIYGEEKHASDDNEPTNTAGLPMLNVLEKEELNQVLAIVIRYFGGIKLGAGGLIRAYTKSITETLKNAKVIELENGYQIKIEFPYEEEKNMKYLFKDSVIVKESYQEKVSYVVNIKESLLPSLEKYSYEILNKIYIKK